MVFNKKLKKVVAVGSLLFLFSLLKLSFVWGSRAFFFSGIFFFVPLLGALGSSLGGAFIVAKVLRYLLLGKLFCATFGLPTLAAAWCWSAEGKFFKKIFVNVFIPITCFFLFVFHPSSSFWYGFYWMIPVILFSQKNIFAVALRSSFIAHAVGSVIWCYMVPVQPAQWIALIPVVAVERFVMAAGMVFVVRLWKYVQKCKHVTEKISGATCSHGDGW